MIGSTFVKGAVLALGLAVGSEARGFGEGYQGYSNYEGGYYRNTYASSTLRLTSNDFGAFNIGAFNTWVANTRCLKDQTWFGGLNCARTIVTQALKDAAQGVVTNSGDAANIIGIRNDTSTKSYVLEDQGQSPGTAPGTGYTPNTCSAQTVQYQPNPRMYPNFRGVKVTCKTGCGSNNFVDSVLSSVANQFFDGMRAEGAFMSQLILWSADSGRARVRCRVTIADRYQDVDTCPDRVDGYGCFIADDER